MADTKTSSNPFDELNMSDEDYLKFFKIGEQKFIIGAFQDGISIYKQQIRALNIFYALIATNRIKLNDPQFRIGIIGGGIAGLTFAAAALNERLKVVVIEEKPIFLHMQHNCDTRKIHPNIYEWPDAKSQFPNTELPVLNWKYDTASNFRKQILYGFSEIKRGFEDDNLNVNHYLFDYPESEVVSVTPAVHSGRKKLDLAFKRKGQTIDSPVDILILATGYGIERGVNTIADTPSYWRNDSFGQSLLYKQITKKTKDKSAKGKGKEKDGGEPEKIRFLISGFGDGGLIDLFRLKIFDFSYDLILNIINKHSKGQDLIAQLAEIKETFSHTDNDPDHLYQQFLDINHKFYNYIHEELEKRSLYQKNVEVIINDKDAPDFKQALNYKKISVINAFIFFALFKNEQFKHGELKFNSRTHKCSINGEVQENIHTVIVRHGTDIDGVYFDSLLLQGDGDQDALKAIKKLQKDHNSITVTRRWNFGKLTLNSNRKKDTDLKMTSANSSGSNFRQLENVIPETVALFTNFISILKSVLEKTSNGKNFKVSIHRVISLRDDLYYQQITSYFGHGSMQGDGAVGQVHPVNRGSVGYSILTGKPLLLKCVNTDNFKCIVEALNLGDDYVASKSLKSCLSVPILAKVKSKTKDEYDAVNLVIYIDSSEETFFDEAKTVELVISTIRGLVDSIVSLIRKRYITMNELEFTPKPINSKHDPFESLDRSCIIQFHSDLHNFVNELNDLKLPNYYSFDVINNKRYSLTTEL